MTEKPTSVVRPSSLVTKIRTGCPAHNCGGRCLLIAHVENGRITRLDSDDRPDSLASPQLRACPRGRAYLRRQYHPDRLLHPLNLQGIRILPGKLQQRATDLFFVRASFGNRESPGSIRLSIDG